MAAASEERMVEEGGGGHGDGGSPSAIGSTQRLPPPPPPQPPQPGSQAPPAPALAPDQLPQNNTLVALPIVAIENILSFMSYDEISQLRLVCKRMDLVCQRMLNQGFLKVERYHNLCQKQVKAQLPRRESERRNHSLARHADILAAVETRLSLLNMTFMKYVDSNLCCFIPGKVYAEAIGESKADLTGIKAEGRMLKEGSVTIPARELGIGIVSFLLHVIDEIYRVLRYVNSTRAPQRAHEVLQELRDISSMAMEYFDEKIVPILKRKLPGSDVSGRLMGSPPVPGPSAALTTMQLFSKQNPSRQEVTKLQQQVKTNGAGVTVLRREISELRTKVQEQQKQLQDQDQKLLEQTQIIGEQNARLAELERKLREVMESAVGDSSGSGQNEESPRKRKKAAEAIDSLRKSKRLRSRK
ncbi:F-box only protein 28 isoform X1 [Mesoplodon densirostris]|uniref:F-box only protein 28 isoform X1 n=1 Tax=Mesoplodon densirostris TaxID=48708 RepID=UPI0028DBDC8A|nr:F-box only protein 28 isoform X1 [Mesoplodon densirostris]